MMKTPKNFRKNSHQSLNSNLTWSKIDTKPTSMILMMEEREQNQKVEKPKGTRLTFQEIKECNKAITS